jgi:hypothetical protein
MRALVLAFIAVAVLTTTTRACHFDMFVYVNGEQVYVVPGSGTSGRVVYSSMYYCKITDRVARGEVMFAILTANNSIERSNPVIYGARVRSQANGQSFPVGVTPSLLYAGDCGWTANFRVPTDPNWDFNEIVVSTASGAAKCPIPIGARQ